MPQTDIAKLDTSDLRTTVTDITVPSDTTDGASEAGETTYTNDDWNDQLGYYRIIPELKAAIDAKAVWTVGNGYIADSDSVFTIGFLSGIGVDTFNTLLENIIRTYNIGGDSFVEIIRNDADSLVNLKPHDPSTIRIVANPKGLIIRYEKISKVGSQTRVEHRFQPEEIFHLARNRIADEIHGQSMITPLEQYILMKNELLRDTRLVMHRFAVPRFIFHVDTDDTTKLAAFKTELERSIKNVEHLIVPKGAVVPELMSVAGNATLNPIPLLNYIDEKFTQASGVPDVILGNSKNFTEASSKTSLIAWGQNVKAEQLYIEESIAAQIGLSIKLEFPVSVLNELISMVSDEKKDNNTGVQQ